MAIGILAGRRGVPSSIRFLALSAALCLAGCVQTGQPVLSSRDRPIAPEDAFVQAPVGGPAVTGAIERRYPNATEQRILLANRSGVPGTNYIEIRFFGPVGNSGTGRTPLANSPLSNSALVREAQGEIAGVAMGRSPLFVQNRYGPFGYAVGRSGQDVCVYAWQRIAGVDTSTLLLRDRGTIQIRLRLCDRAASEERLLYSMYGLTIRAHFSSLSWNPYGAPPAADPRLGALNAPILPVGAGGFEAIADAPPAAPQAAAARRVRTLPRAEPARATVSAAPTVVQPAAPAPLPGPVGPLVPPPPLSATGAAAPLTPVAEGGAPAAANTAVPVAVPPPPPVPGPACDAAGREAGRC